MHMYICACAHMLVCTYVRMCSCACVCACECSAPGSSPGHSGAHFPMLNAALFSSSICLKNVNQEARSKSRLLARLGVTPGGEGPRPASVHRRCCRRARSETREEGTHDGATTPHVACESTRRACGGSRAALCLPLGGTSSRARGHVRPAHRASARTLPSTTGPTMISFE